MENAVASEVAEVAEVVIRGQTSQGRTFRPSDWADRLAGIASEVGSDHRLNYRPCVQPVTRDGVRCVVIDRSLEQLDRRIFQFLLDFAQDNDLQVVEGRRKPRD